MKSEIHRPIELLRENKDFSVEALEALIPHLGLNNEDLQQQPEEYKEYFGKGLKMWQYPNQLARFGNFISQLSVEKYLEIGCRWGGTFIFISEILKRNNPNIELYACDIIPQSEILNEYLNYGNFTYKQQSSQSDEFKSFCRELRPDMVFIDGDHGYHGVKQDFEIFEDIKETKVLVFHDIVSAVCPGVPKFWNEITYDTRFKNFEYIDQYNSVVGNYLGIGILVRK